MVFPSHSLLWFCIDGPPILDLNWPRLFASDIFIQSFYFTLPCCFFSFNGKIVVFFGSLSYIPVKFRTPSFYSFSGLLVSHIVLFLETFPLRKQQLSFLNSHFFRLLTLLFKTFYNVLATSFAVFFFRLVIAMIVICKFKAENLFFTFCRFITLQVEKCVYLLCPLTKESQWALLCV